MMMVVRVDQKRSPNLVRPHSIVRRRKGDTVVGDGLHCWQCIIVVVVLVGVRVATPGATTIHNEVGSNGGMVVLVLRSKWIVCRGGRALGFFQGTGFGWLNVRRLVVERRLAAAGARDCDQIGWFVCGWSTHS